MSFSVNTNAGAMIALQYLNQTQGQLDQTQSEINSGLKVASAKDDGAIYAIAQNQRGAVAGYQSVLNSLNNGSSAIDVALSAGQSLCDLVLAPHPAGAASGGGRPPPPYHDHEPGHEPVGFDRDAVHRRLDLDP